MKTPAQQATDHYNRGLSIRDRAEAYLGLNRVDDAKEAYAVLIEQHASTMGDTVGHAMPGQRRRW